MRSYGATDVGRRREANEDSFLRDDDVGLWVVADGMGGHAAGEVASSIAVHEIRDAVNNNRDLIDRYRVDHPGVQAYEILQVLEHAIHKQLDELVDAPPPKPPSAKAPAAKAPAAKAKKGTARSA